jgi:hypothetical protein
MPHHQQQQHQLLLLLLLLIIIIFNLSRVRLVKYFGRRRLCFICCRVRVRVCECECDLSYILIFFFWLLVVDVLDVVLHLPHLTACFLQQLFVNVCFLSVCWSVSHSACLSVCLSVSFFSLCLCLLCARHHFTIFFLFISILNVCIFTVSFRQ